jgi:hypothetical protein
MSDDLNSSLDYLWEMLTDQGLYMEANIVALAQNRIEKLEAKSRKRLSAMEAMGFVKLRYKETLEYLRLSNGDKP